MNQIYHTGASLAQIHFKNVHWLKTDIHPQVPRPFLFTGEPGLLCDLEECVRQDRDNFREVTSEPKKNPQFLAAFKIIFRKSSLRETPHKVPVPPPPKLSSQEKKKKKAPKIDPRYSKWPRLSSQDSKRFSKTPDLLKKLLQGFQKHFPPSPLWG